eukprot:gene13311-13440_t
MRYMDYQCLSDSLSSEQQSDDSDISSAAPARRSKSSQKSSKSRSSKVRTLNRWTTEEHDKLAYLVDKWGSEKNWAKVAEEMPGRTGKQCRERWLNHMKPGIIKGNWSQEEEFLLAQCHALVGSHWSKMTKRLPGRTENSIKNFWNATLRSKAPNKKRGMLWTYMQLHDPKSDDNSAALTSAVTRLHDSRELPSHLLAQMDSQLLDHRTWRAIHKAEKDYLENSGGELHPLALPHPGTGGLLEFSAQQRAYMSMTSLDHHLDDEPQDFAGCDLQLEGLHDIGVSSAEPPAAARDSSYSRQHPHPDLPGIADHRGQSRGMHSQAGVKLSHHTGVKYSARPHAALQYDQALGGSKGSSDHPGLPQHERSSLLWHAENDTCPLDYHAAASTRRTADVNSGVAGGHGAHCSCGPCVNSRKLHGLHSPGARKLSRTASSATTHSSTRIRSLDAVATSSDAAALPAHFKVHLQRATDRADGVRLPSFGQIVLQRASVSALDWDWEALLMADGANHANCPSATGQVRTAAGSLNISNNQLSGAKRARPSVTSVDDDAALLIDMQPAKVVRGSEALASTSFYSSWMASEFANKHI